ncbi:ABC transporter permease [Parafilimonas sp.]|uniref:ABC transporter permease n=1 Tax=Parafilimonas sp. TaxID=1969739 RepID=UPI0039E66EAD
MFKNYLKTAWRSIFRNKAITLINLFGLSVALVAFIFISLWVQNELSFDDYHKDAKDIYLVQTKVNMDNEPSPLTSLPVADVLNSSRYVKNVARMAVWKSALNVNGQLFNERSGAAVDSDWFKIFDYKIIGGDINAFNRNPFSLIFTRSRAKQLFGDKNPVGQIVKLDTTLYQVRAIAEDNPVNSSLQFDMLVPMAARLAHRQPDNNWGNLSYRTFVKVFPNTNAASFAQNATALSQQASGKTDFSIGVQSLHELHFDTKSFDPAFRRGSHTAIFVFSVLAVLLLITASINYVNLSIAKANSRSKEISIRKIIGGSRAQLFLQFLSESFLLCLMALFISFIIIRVTLPIFNNLTGTNFSLSASSGILWMVLSGTLLFTTLLNGVFPALTMSLFKPLYYLHGYTILKFKNILIRKGLVVFQFIIGVVFIIGTVVIFQQMRLAQTSAAQYNRSQVVSFELPSSSLQKMNYDQQKVNDFSQAIKNELQQSSSLQSIALANSSIEGNMNSGGAGNWYWPGMDTSLSVQVARLFVTPEAKSIFNFQMREGRWFNNDISDKKNYILNETAVKELGIHPPVIGQVFAKSGGDTGRIIGVIKDYNFNSLYNKIGPMVIANNNGDEWEPVFFAKIAPGNISQAMDAVAATWKKFIPYAPFEYQFMNQAFDNLYKDDLKVSKLALLFSCICIIISALGLFGLAAFVAEQRRKEIGIRKVMGATVTQITTMLSKDFVKLVLIAIVIASPIGWWAMRTWLQNFVYRINISWWIFLIAGSTAILIAVLTVSFQAIRAAMANPVKSLRTE